VQVCRHATVSAFISGTDNGCRVPVTLEALLPCGALFRRLVEAGLWKKL
jgi:hypothetical protein